MRTHKYCSWELELAITLQKADFLSLEKEKQILSYV